MENCQRNFFVKWFTRIMSLIGFCVCMVLIFGIFFNHKLVKKYNSENVAHIKINGAIITSEETDSLFRGYDFTIADDVISLLEDIEKDKSIKAILVEINSPGGTPVASAEIANALNKCKVPKVSWIRETGASGAYWVAMVTDFIVCHPMSITGSIGVLANSFGFEKVLELLKIEFRRQVAGSFKDIGSPYRAETEDEKQYIQNIINQIHEEFIKAFIAGRKLDESTARETANGLFYTGTDALDKKLVDKLGSKDEVLEWLKTQIKEEPVLRAYDAEGSFFQNLMKKMQVFFRKTGFSLSRGAIGGVLNSSYGLQLK
ncbi:MAG: hypothetical protein ACD_79C00938G0007 [uncultured bacterium]|nr:MAG: hypothetical protein ACD_79C00938G0007 [uncultured bacterium]